MRATQAPLRGSVGIGAMIGARRSRLPCRKGVNACGETGRGRTYKIDYSVACFIGREADRADIGRHVQGWTCNIASRRLGQESMYDAGTRDRGSIASPQNVRESVVIQIHDKYAERVGVCWDPNWITECFRRDGQCCTDCGGKKKQCGAMDLLHFGVLGPGSYR
jgi:hypothetical protein